MAANESSGGWTFLTNHGQVLICIAKNPDVRISEIADLVGIGERAAQRIVGDLVEAGYVTRIKVGRRNRYTIDGGLPLRHPLAQERSVRRLIHALTAPSTETLADRPSETIPQGARSAPERRLV